MSKTTVLMVLLMALQMTGLGALGGDKPVNGQWEFKPEGIWSVQDFQGEFWGKPQAVLILENGNVAVFDPKLKKSVLLDSSGRYLTSFAPQGEGPREVKAQSFWYVVDGQLIIPDMGGVHYYDETGTWLETRKIQPMPPPRGFIDRDHMVMVPRTVFEIGDEKGMFRIVDLLGNGHRDLLEISNLFRGGFARDGKEVMDILVSGLSPMIEVGIGPDFMVYGMSSEYELVRIDMQGRRLGRFGLKRMKVPISHEQIAAHLRSPYLTQEKARALAESFPEEAVYFEGIEIHGRQIWVRNACVAKLTAELAYDIFSFEGQYLYRAVMKIPRGEIVKSPFGNHFIRGDRLAALVEMEDGSQNLVCYRIRTPR